MAAPESRWWQSFNDPYLNTLIEQALQQSFDIAEAAARLDRARAGIRFAAGAKLPAIAASADAAAVRLSKEDPEFQSVSNLPGFERNVDRYSVSIGASWELDLFGRLGDREKAAVADTASASWKLEAAKLTVTTEIAQRYITLRLLQQRNIVAERRAFTLSEQARLSAMRVERGVSPAIERDRLIAEARIARSSVPPLLAAIEDQMARIDVLVGRTVGTSREELGEAQALPTAGVIDLALAPADLLNRRPDILAALASLAAQDARVAGAHADRLPRFNLAGLIGTIAGAINPLFGSAALNLQGSAGINYTAFDGGRSRANLDVARADVASASAIYQRTVLSAIADVEAAASARASAERRARDLTEAETLLSNSLVSLQLAQSQGAASLSDVLDVDRRLQESRDTLVVAQADKLLASIALVQALGGGASDGYKQTK
ncbi:efflux transporter outer membrane subunit [Parasphingorhabdus sp.]|uniref:efflux transporter outer membrane subunit n=1 Tax=Parasphingorhabdus sp. TaxID=2709688 RepID=UPI0030037FD8